MRRFSIIFYLLSISFATLAQPSEIKIPRTSYPCVYNTDKGFAFVANDCQDSVHNKNILEILLESKDIFQSTMKLSTDQLMDSKCLFASSDTVFFEKLFKTLNELESPKNKTCVVTIFHNEVAKVRFGGLRVFSNKDFCKFTRKVSKLIRRSSKITELEQRKSVQKLYEGTDEYLFILFNNELKLFRL